jgi:hypothetical protein
MQSKENPTQKSSFLIPAFAGLDRQPGNFLRMGFDKMYDKK